MKISLVKVRYTVTGKPEELVSSPSRPDKIFDCVIFDCAYKNTTNYTKKN